MIYIFKNADGSSNFVIRANSEYSAIEKLLESIWFTGASLVDSFTRDAIFLDYPSGDRRCYKIVSVREDDLREVMAF